MWEYNNSDELYHYGILGMKWGVRKDRGLKGTRPRHKKKKMTDIQQLRAEKKIVSDLNKKRYKEAKRNIKTAHKLSTMIDPSSRSQSRIRSIVSKNEARRNYHNIKKNIKKSTREQKATISRYGKTSARILGEGIVRNIAIDTITIASAKAAKTAGKNRLAKSLITTGKLALMGSEADMIYKMAVNYKPKS